MANKYTSECCAAQGKKPALVKPKKGEDQLGGLGKWVCGACGKKTKVKVTLDKTT